MRNRFLRRRPSPAMVIALVALFVALGGSAYAGLVLPRNSVGSLQIRAGAVGNGEIAPRAVSTSKVRDSAIITTKIADGNVTFADIAPGSVLSSKLGALTVRQNSRTFGAPQDGNNARYQTRRVQVNCAPGEKAVGAGTRWSGGNDENVTTSWLAYVVQNNVPIGVVARGGIDENFNRTFTVQVLCLQAG